MINNDIKVIGIGGYAKSGKDTFVSIAKNILQRNGYKPYRVAFADTLKREVVDMLKNNSFTIDMSNLTPEEKETIRPLLVWWGCQRRRESPDGLYWIAEVNYNIDKKVDICCKMDGDPTDKLVFLVSDCRFVNECEWVQTNRTGVFIHLKRYSTTLVYDEFTGQEVGKIEKIYDDAPNDEERKNDPLIQKIADFCIEWENIKSFTPNDAVNNPFLQEIVLNTLNNTKYFIDSKLK
jgi:hypothetical protein